MNSKSDTKRGNMGRKFTPAALLLVLILMLSLACSGDDPTPAPETDQTQQELLRTIERMGQEIDSLQQEMEEPKETKDADEASDREEETALRPATTPLPTSTPELAVIPTPSVPGICGRSPEVQKAILVSLNINLCRAVTEDELFRITTFGVKMNTAKAGDFHGLVNVKELGLEIRDVEPGGFSGMTSLKEMHVTVYTYGSIAPGAFQGLGSLEKLTINTSKPYPEPEDTLTLPDFDQLPSLKYLEMKDAQILFAGTLSGNLLANLPSLESIQMWLQLKESESDEDTELDIHIPKGLFAANRMLKIAVINVQDRRGTTVHIPEALFRNNSSLEEVSIGGRHQVIPTNTFRRLTKLERLRVLGTPDGEVHQLNLSEKSPLYNKVKYGGESTQGYKVLDAQD